MTEKLLFTVPDVAILIEKATGQSMFDVAKNIEHTAWEHYAKPGHGQPLEVYNCDGRRTRYRPGLYGVTIDPQKNDPLEERRTFTDYVPYLHLLVDLIEVLDALEYHPEVRAKILAERDKPAQADAVAPLAGGDAISNDASGTVKVWTPERMAGREMQAKILAEREKSVLTGGAAPSSTRTHKLRGRIYPLTAEIEEAKSRAISGDDVNSVWAELIKMAEGKEGLFIGYSSDGPQYRGKKYQETGVPDVFTLRALRDRMNRAKERQGAV